MSRFSEFTRSLRELGEIQVNDWDFKGLMNTELKDLEIAEGLRRLGNLKVLDWDFAKVLPSVHRLAHTEVSFHGSNRGHVASRVTDWDFRTNAGESAPAPAEAIPEAGPAERQALADRLRIFLHYVLMNLAHEPDRARIEIKEIEPAVLRFRIIVGPRDIKDLIGRGGATGASIRHLVQAKAESEGVRALVEILSYEELGRPR